ncbi:MAG: hypothetical protein WCH98_09220 [Verrucomicrobiota bacterium]
MKSSHARRTKLQSAIIGYAGVVSELLRNDLDLEAWSVLESIEYETIPSDTDWDSIRKIHPSWRERAITRCIAILKTNWNQVEHVALALVKDFEFEREYNPDANEHDGSMGAIFFLGTLPKGGSK